MRLSSAIVLSLALAWSSACATGSKARLVTTFAQSGSGYSTSIVAIDGKIVYGGSFKLTPGRHVVEVEGTGEPDQVIPGEVLAGVWLVNPAFSMVGAVVSGIMTTADAMHSGRMRACFIARPERTYEVRTYVEGRVWNIQVVDQSSTYDVKSPCKSSRASAPTS